jgi:hypothetical protein
MSKTVMFFLAITAVMCGLFLYSVMSDVISGFTTETETYIPDCVAG